MMTKTITVSAVLFSLSLFFCVPARAAESSFAQKMKGKILLQVESYGRAWYVNPVDLRRYYIKKIGDDQRAGAIGVSNVNLRKIPMNTTQIVQDTAFDDVAWVLMKKGKVVASKNKDQILSPASLTKLMTALVLRDQPASFWEQSITLTSIQLEYPQSVVGGDDVTSEIHFAEGDRVRTRDLWVAMLVASSNQAAIALVDASGLSRAEFVAQMNKKADTLGLQRTHFEDPTGLDANTVTTAKEMAIVAQTAFADPIIAHATRENGYVISTQQSPGRTLTVVDRNYSLQKFGADAAKTGFLVEAQRTVAIKKAERTIVVLHARSMAERNAALKRLTIL